MDIKIALKKIWEFVWHSDSIWSWLVNIILAFVIIKFLVYPGLGFVLSTDYPIVAVVSESMEHDKKFDLWWSEQSLWYEKAGITKEVFQAFPYQNGFNKGDIMILYGKKPSQIDVGDILVFQSQQPNPIIHRVVKKWLDDDQYHFQTKGDHNLDSIQNYVNTKGQSVKPDYFGAVQILDETNITEDKLIGVGVIRVPFLGWIKIIFTDYILTPFVKLVQAVF